MTQAYLLENFNLQVEISSKRHINKLHVDFFTNSIISRILDHEKYEI